MSNTLITNDTMGTRDKPKPTVKAVTANQVYDHLTSHSQMSAARKNAQTRILKHQSERTSSSN